MDDDPPNNSIWDLEHISTQWSQISDTNVFVLRYTQAIRNYLRHLLRSEEAADEVLQSFLLKVVERGFKNADPARGRFRHYLSRSVRNAAITYRRSIARDVERRERLANDVNASNDVPESTWNQEWYACILRRAMRRLEHRETTVPGNLGYTILQLHVADGEQDSAKLARRVAEISGKAMNAAAFRKQLSRARQALAQFVIQEVAETLDNPTQDELQDELKEVGLWPFVENFV